MAVNVPDTTWRRTSGNGELATTDSTLVTDDSKQLITLSELSLIALPGSYSAIPDTEWIGADTPDTDWRPTDGLSEFSSDSPNDIVDNLGNNLVDTLGNQIVDTGVTETLIPDTEWIEDDSL